MVLPIINKDNQLPEKVASFLIKQDTSYNQIKLWPNICNQTITNKIMMYRGYYILKNITCCYDFWYESSFDSYNNMGMCGSKSEEMQAHKATTHQLDYGKNKKERIRIFQVDLILSFQVMPYVLILI